MYSVSSTHSKDARKMATSYKQLTNLAAKLTLLVWRKEAGIHVRTYIQHIISNKDDSKIPRLEVMYTNQS